MERFLSNLFAAFLTILTFASAHVCQADSPTDNKNDFADRSARTDLHGDPLPFGAISRIGTIRLWHANTILSIAYSPNGTSLAVSTHNGLHLWEIATVKQLLFFPVEGFYEMAFSPDGAVLVGQTDSPKRKLYLWDRFKLFSLQ